MTDESNEPVPAVRGGRSGSAGVAVIRPSDVDPELAEIRARRLREMLSVGRSPAVPPSPVPGPVPLTTSAISGFLSENTRAVIDVWAEWCGPCRSLAPIVEALAREFAGSIRFAKLNADDHPEAASRYGVEGLPTLLLFERGRLIDRIVGALPRPALQERLERTFRLRASPRSAPAAP